MWFLRRQLFGNRQNFQGFYKQYRSDGFNTRQQYGDRNQYNRNNNNQQDSSHYERKKKSGSDRESSQSHDPYVILNVRRGATKDEIKKAYKEMIKKYHPDKVAYLGEEFQKMAHGKMVDIQKAYETLMNK